jgi:hypothetical protein
MKQAQFEMELFTIWIFDFIGQQSQGVCIDRSSRSIIIGQRSNKGYDTITSRPLHCLAKTMAHELGHALGLDHPEGRHFSNGDKLCFSGLRNLMSGGSDRRGGGGEYLEDWQIITARKTALDFLAARQTHIDLSQDICKIRPVKNDDHETAEIDYEIVTGGDERSDSSTYTEAESSISDKNKLLELIHDQERHEY